MKKRVWILGVLVLIALLVLAACGDDDGDGDNGGSGNEGGNTGGGQQAEPAPDLVITAIEVLPAQPQAGVPFTLTVYVSNTGDAASEDFELALSIRDVSRGSTYPVGTFRGDALQPGENVPVYTTNDRRVNDAGNFQVQAELNPFGEDANPGNNTKMKAFTVN